MSSCRATNAKCSVCKQPAHASETDDTDRCRACIAVARRVTLAKARELAKQLRAHEDGRLRDCALAQMLEDDEHTGELACELADAVLALEEETDHD